MRPAFALGLADCACLVKLCPCKLQVQEAQCLSLRLLGVSRNAHSPRTKLMLPHGGFAVSPWFPFQLPLKLPSQNMHTHIGKPPALHLHPQPAPLPRHGFLDTLPVPQVTCGGSTLSCGQPSPGACPSFTRALAGVRALHAVGRMTCLCKHGGLHLHPTMSDTQSQITQLVS